MTVVSAAWWTIALLIMAVAALLLSFAVAYLLGACSVERRVFAASALRAVTWPLFVVALAVSAALIYFATAYVADPTLPYRGELGIAWSWLAVYGFTPIALLVLVAILRYRTVGGRRALLLLVPPLLAIVSGIMLFSF